MYLPISNLPGLDGLTKVPAEVRAKLGDVESNLQSMIPMLAGLQGLDQIGDLQAIAGQMAGIGNISELMKSPESLLQNLEALPKELAEQLVGLPKKLLGDVSALAQHPKQLLSFAGSKGITKMAKQLQQLPQQLLEQVKNLPQTLLSQLGGLDPSALQDLLKNPQAAIDQLTSKFKGLAGLGDLGIFKVRSVRGKDLPEFVKPLEEWLASTAHVTTQAPEITRYLEYGKLEMPDYWASQDQ